MLNSNVLAEAGVKALLGYGVVFLGLFLLMVVVAAMGKLMTGKKDSKPASAPETVRKAPAAPGSCGSCKLYDTPDRDAAMVMAIVAHQLGKPLNELRFKSIKEVK